jgi:hypothetical protein
MIMKLVGINGGAIGLLVELPAGPHVIDLAKSLGVLRVTIWCRAG